MPIQKYEKFINENEDYDFADESSSDQLELKKLNQSILLNKLIQNGITNVKAQANILAQIENESNFIQKTEFTNWSAKSLLAYYASKFGNKEEESLEEIKKKIDVALLKDKKDSDANKYPPGQYILSIIYGGRNGNKKFEDGYNFRGRGFIQLSGKSNYVNMSKHVNADLVKNPELVNDPKYVFDIVIIYFTKLRGLSPTELQKFERVNNAVAYKGYNKKSSKKRIERYNDSLKYIDLIKNEDIVPFDTKDKELASLYKKFYGKETDVVTNLKSSPKIKDKDVEKTSLTAVAYHRTGDECFFEQPGTVELKKTILKEFPGSTDMGIFNCRKVRGGTSLSLHGEGRATDIGGTSEIMQDVADWCVKNSKKYGIQEVIYDRKIWSSEKSEEGWRNYKGKHGHEDHVHIGQNWSFANPEFALEKGLIDSDDVVKKEEIDVAEVEEQPIEVEEFVRFDPKEIEEKGLDFFKELNVNDFKNA